MMVPAPRCAHPGQERLHAVIGAVEVRGEDAVPVVYRQRLETAARDVDARGVHQDVDFAKAPEHGRAHRRHGVCVADVAGEHDDPAISA